MELEATESASGRLICSRYAAVLGVGLRFAENDIDFTLGDLPDQDLEKIGVVSLGHRG